MLGIILRHDDLKWRAATRVLWDRNVKVDMVMFGDDIPQSRFEGLNAYQSGIREREVDRVGLELIN